MDWRVWITSGYADRAYEVRPEFREGASPERLSQLEAQMGLRIPEALREVLQQTDGVGVSQFLGDGWKATDTDVWSCDKIAEQNQTTREDPEYYLPPPGAPQVKPFYFAPVGADGILFAFLVHGEDREDPAVYAYYPIEQEWRRISPSLAVHLKGGWIV